jgi:chlorobactene glucosyltransferase
LQLHTITGQNEGDALSRNATVDSGRATMGRIFVIWVLLVPLIGLTLFTLWNAPRFPRLASFAPNRDSSGHAGSSGVPPFVSILIPARDEESNLANLLPSLMAQGYANFEVVVLDDHSSDRTLEVAHSFALRDSRFRVVAGGPLLPGWLGKPNACQQLIDAARGELLVFTDADTVWNPNAIATVAAAFEQTGCDALSGWPEQVLSGWFSSLIQPFMAWSLVAFLPMWLVPDPRFPGTVSANGQLLAFRRRTLERVEGFVGVRGSILEDMLLAKSIKRAGMRFEFVNARGVVTCKMYDSARDAFDGFAKAAFINVGSSVQNLGLAIVGFAFGFVLPWIWLGWSLATGADLTWPLVAVVASVAGRAASDAQFGFPLWLSLTQPLAVIGWIAIALTSYRRHEAGRVHWKGRAYDLKQGEHPTS